MLEVIRLVFDVLDLLSYLATGLLIGARALEIAVIGEATDLLLSSADGFVALAVDLITQAHKSLLSLVPGPQVSPGTYPYFTRLPKFD